MPWLLKPLGRAMRRLLLWQLRRTAVGDPWALCPAWIRPPGLGPGLGSGPHFQWYRDGPTAVHPRTVAELCDWLSGCQYVSDHELFRVVDLWQHPATFERIRQGDCEDFALWAWRKLLELDLDAWFFCGRVLVGPRQEDHHAWAVFQEKRQQVLLEPTLTRDAMLRPLVEARAVYIPYVSVGRDCQPRGHEGLIDLLERLRM
jgi:hypothetical protein